MSELLTIPETAERLGITVKAVEKRIERGTIQSLRRDGRRVVPDAEVRRVVEQRKAQAGQGIPREGTTFPGEDFAGFLQRLETLAAENGRFRALQEVGESERQRLEDELFKARAEVRELEAKLHAQDAEQVALAAPARRRFFRRNT